MLPRKVSTSFLFKKRHFKNDIFVVSTSAHSKTVLKMPTRVQCRLETNTKNYKAHLKGSYKKLQYTTSLNTLMQSRPSRTVFSLCKLSLTYNTATSGTTRRQCNDLIQKKESWKMQEYKQKISMDSVLFYNNCCEGIIVLDTSGLRWDTRGRLSQILLYINRQRPCMTFGLNCCVLRGLPPPWKKK